MNFKAWLIEEAARRSSELNRFVKNGKVELWHFTRGEGERMLLDPKRFGENPFTRNESKVGIPRIFFYLDPNQKEGFFVGNALYKTQVPASRIYDLTQDTYEILDKSTNPFGITQWGTLMAAVREAGYPGMYYRIGGGSTHFVVWFEPIVVELAEPQKKIA